MKGWGNMGFVRVSVVIGDTEYVMSPGEALEMYRQLDRMFNLGLDDVGGDLPAETSAEPHPAELDEIRKSLMVMSDDMASLQKFANQLARAIDVIRKQPAIVPVPYPSPLPWGTPCPQPWWLSPWSTSSGSTADSSIFTARATDEA